MEEVIEKLTAHVLKELSVAHDIQRVEEGKDTFDATGKKATMLCKSLIELAATINMTAVELGDLLSETSGSDFNKFLRQQIISVTSKACAPTSRQKETPKG